MDNSAITEIDPWIRYPVVLVFVAFIFVIVGYGAARNRRRFQRFARRHGLRYLDNDRWGVEAPPDSMLASLGPMGTDAQMRAATEGAIDGHEVSVFECAYAREHGATKGYPVTVVQIDTGISLPHFTLRPEKLRHKLAAIAGKDDIDLAECPSFSKRFLLRGEAPSALRDLFRSRAPPRLDHQL